MNESFIRRGMRRLIVQSTLFLFKNYIHPVYSRPVNWEAGPRIIVLNHSTTFEVFLTAAFLLDKSADRLVTFVDWMYGYLPVSGWILSLIETIYVYNKPAKFGIMERIRQRGMRDQAQDLPMRYIAEDFSISLYPEGTRNKDPQKLLRGRRGVGYMALHSEAKVLPIGLDFPSRMHRGRIPVFDHLIMRIGEDIDFSLQIRQLKAILNNKTLESNRKRRYIHYLYDLATYRIMVSLSGLCRKRYTLAEPAIPQDFPRYVSGTNQ